MMLPSLHVLFSQLLVASDNVTVSCNDGKNIFNCDTGLIHVGAGNSEVQQILTIAFGIIAALAVLMIVISGFRLIVSQGTPQETSKARNTIIYALVGLIVSLSAEAIVSLVIGKA